MRQKRAIIAEKVAVPVESFMYQMDLTTVCLSWKIDMVHTKPQTDIFRIRIYIPLICGSGKNDRRK